MLQRVALAVAVALATPALAHTGHHGDVGVEHDLSHAAVGMAVLLIAIGIGVVHVTRQRLQRNRRTRAPQGER
jgi:hydrogenase/urease accessory protein HupE